MELNYERSPKFYASSVIDSCDNLDKLDDALEFLIHSNPDNLHRYVLNTLLYGYRLMYLEELETLRTNANKLLELLRSSSNQENIQESYPIGVLED